MKTNSILSKKNRKYKKAKPALDQHCRHNPQSLDIVDQPQNVENVKPIQKFHLVLRDSGVVGFNKARFVEMVDFDELVLNNEMCASWHQLFACLLICGLNEVRLIE